MAVDLSASSFAAPDLTDRIAQRLRRHALPARQLELELTEGVLMRSGAEALAALESLEREGLRLAIDDFGTGYSSRSPISSACASTRSRSTAASCATSRAIPTTAPSWRR